MPQVETRVSFSGVVVCYNEAHLLRQCLESIDFCQELIIVDLGSTDDSLAIVRDFGAKILYHELVPYPNLPRQYGFKHASHEWIITIDPDEVFPKDEIRKIETVILEQGNNLAGIRIPWQFYFRSKALKYSVWGRPDATWCAVVHRDRIQTTPYVHKEFTSEQNIYCLSRSESKPLQHYWMSSYRQLFHKMGRYVKTEGESKYEVEGKRFSWLMMLKYTAASLKVNLFDYRGLFGGFTGIFLSFFHAWYVFMSWLSLKQYERRRAITDKR